MQDKRVGIASRRGSVYSSGIGRIIIPYGVDRDSFVKNCYINGMVSIIAETNNAIHRIRCDKGVLQQIEFPVNSSGLGSYVVFVTMPKSKMPIIIACIDSIYEYGDLNENQFKLSKSTDFGSATILGDGNGHMYISVKSEYDTKGKIDINLSNSNNSAQFNIVTKGTFDLFSTGKISTISNDVLELKAIDGENESLFNIAPNQIKVVSESINHNEGSEPMLLGQSTIDLLKELINLVATATNAGGPLSTSAQISQLVSKLDALLSKKSKLD